MRHKTQKVPITSTQSGFTIVELLIVIIVIAILATIIIVAYNGIRQRAIESSLKSDLNGSAKRVEIDREQGGLASYPAPGNVTLAQSNGNTVTYVLKPYGYCISAVNGSQTFSIRSTTRKIETGSCGITVTTLAGTDTAGYTDGTGSSARFVNPGGITTGSDGTIYVADGFRIRKVTPEGAVSFLAGSGTNGNTNGPATTAQFNNTGKMVTDGSGSLYIVQGASHQIKKIDTSTGDVATFTGLGTSCNFSRGNLTDGPFATARLDGPTGISINSSGVFYISESKSNRVREAQSDGSLATYAGSGALNSCTANSAQAGNVNGPRLSAQFNNLTDISIGKDNTIYLAEYGSSSIKTISPDGTVALLATLPLGPQAIAVDTLGTVYASTAYGIYSVSSTGSTSLIAGSTGSGFIDGAGTTARFRAIGDITLSGDQTVLYVADSQNYSIRKVQL